MKTLQNIVSLSGGETSMYMVAKQTEKHPETICVFANTGQEMEETYEFIRDGTAAFDLTTVWLEAVVNQRGISTSHRIVNFDTAHRGGDIFEAIISKYGIPNQAYPHCTRELKNNPIRSYLKEKYGRDGYKIAIGIRSDETKRFPSSEDNMYRTYYPMLEEGEDKEDVFTFFSDQPVKLKIPNYRGNCKTCYKKSNKKLSVIYFEDPESFDFNRSMESIHGLSGSNKDGSKRVFFRGNQSTDELIASFPDADYNSIRRGIINDYGNHGADGCSESCEAFQEVLFADSETQVSGLDEIIKRHRMLYPQPRTWKPDDLDMYIKDNFPKGVPADVFVCK